MAYFQSHHGTVPQLKFWILTSQQRILFNTGPICTKEYRGKGLINSFFEFMRIHMVKHPLSLTFINKINIPSTKAHNKLKWTIIADFQFNNNNYYILAYDMVSASSN
jgi:hypothetical protein